MKMRKNVDVNFSKLINLNIYYYIYIFCLFLILCFFTYKLNKIIKYFFYNIKGINILIFNILFKIIFILFNQAQK